VKFLFNLIQRRCGLPEGFGVKIVYLFSISPMWPSCFAYFILTNLNNMYWCTSLSLP